MRSIALQALAVVLLTSVGCTNATKAELTGTWVMDESSRQILPPEFKNATPRIVLRSNGTFEASEMVGFFYFPPEAIQSDAGSGVWKLIRTDIGTKVQLEFRSLTGGTNVGVPYGTQLNILRIKSISLDYSIGDPDEGKTVSFHKT